MSSSLEQAAAKGALFTLSAQAARIVIQLASVVVLARMLSPHDYGLLAIALVVVGFGEMFRDFGLTSASIQASELTSVQRDNLFWVNTLIGFMLAVLMFCSSWYLGALTSEPQLVGIAQWLALTFVINGLAAQHRAMLMRHLQLRGLSIVDVIASASALGTAVVAALLGAGYWALVVQQLTVAGITLIGVVAVGRWLPRRYSRSASIRSLLHFGWSLVATNMIGYAARQIDTVLIASRFGTVSLGLYNRAFQLVMTPLGQVRSPLQSVGLPLLSRVQEDTARFNTYVVAAQLALGYLIGIPLAIAAGLAEPVVEIMLGHKWSDAAPLVRMFAIAGLLTTLSFVGYWVYLSRGLGGALLRYTIVTTVIKIVCIAVGSLFGVVGVAIAFAVHPAIAWPISLAWLSRVTPMPRRRLYEGATRIVILTLAAGSAAYCATVLLPTAPIAQLLVGTGAGLLFAAASLALPVYRRDAASLSVFVRLMVKRVPGSQGSSV